MNIEFKKELRLIVLWLIENKNDTYISKRLNSYIELLEYYYEMDINNIVKISGLDIEEELKKRSK